MSSTRRSRSGSSLLSTCESSAAVSRLASRASTSGAIFVTSHVRMDAIAGLRGSGLHQRGAAADRDGLAALVEALMLEFDDPGVAARAAGPLRDHRRLRADRVAMKHRLREAHIGHPEIGDRGA